MPGSFDAIVFDWYATLASPASDDWFPSLEALLRAEGAGVAAEAFAAWMTPPTDHRRYSADEATYREYEERQLQKLLAASSLSTARRAELCAEIMRLRDAEEVRVYDDVVGFLDEVRSAGLRVGLCSNWSWDLERHLAYNAIENHFDVVVCSAIAGYRKPHREIFNQLLDGLGVEPRRVAFVGDDWSADVEGARAAELFAIHLAREGCAVEPHADVPCVQSLDGVRPLIF